MDFAAEGLLEGLSGTEREARERLLNELAEAGFTAEQLKEASRQDRLSLLPAERLLASEEKYTSSEVAELAGIDHELFLTMRKASGLPAEDPGARVFDDADVEAARAIGSFVSAGLDPDGLIEMARIFGELTARTAAATRVFITESIVSSGETDEDRLGLMIGTAARELRPLTEFLIAYLYRLHIREQVRNEAAITALPQGGVAGAREVSIGFADLAGFTWLGETIAPDELGGLAGRLGRLIAEAVTPPVTLIKMVGDAGLLVSEDNDALIETALRLVEVAADQADDLPPLKVGIARGEAIHRFGDWYGSPVNVADRVTSIARPGSVLVTEEVKAAAEGDYQWSFARERHLKGVGRPIKLYRVRALEAD